MITGLGNVTIYVSDQDRSVEFYVSTLGLELRRDVTIDADPAPEVTVPVRWIEVGVAGHSTTLALVGRDFDTLREGKVTGQFTDIQFITDDIRTTHAELERKGVRFTIEPQQTPFGWRAEFVDPDGNGYNLIQPDPELATI